MISLARKHLFHNNCFTQFSRTASRTNMSYIKPAALAMRYFSIKIFDQSHLEGTSQLHYFVTLHCSGSSRLLACSQLLKGGVDPNFPDKDGITPLHTAVTEPGCSYHERIQLIALLLNHKADPNTYDGWSGFTPFHRVMVSNGFNPEQRLELTKMMLENKGNPNFQDFDKKACLHLLVPYRKLFEINQVLSELFAAGADLRIRDASGRTAIDLATSQRVKEFMLQSKMRKKHD